jgi:hypothetical protein
MLVIQHRQTGLFWVDGSAWSKFRDDGRRFACEHDAYMAAYVACPADPSDVRAVPAELAA